MSLLQHDAGVGPTSHDGSRPGDETSSLFLAPTACSTTVPEVLAPERTLRYVSDFRREYAPEGPTEHALVGELARHAAAMDRWDAGSGAVERQALQRLPELLGHPEPNAAARQDVALAGAMSTEVADRCERHGLLRSRAFLRTLDKLEQVQAARRRRARNAANMPPLGFADERACEDYLIARLRGDRVRCPRCGSTEGCYLPTRKRRECRGCRLQIGLRGGTVMARSPVGLRPWFDAVRRLQWRPTLGTKELADALGITRLATVRSMAAKILAAMTADDADARLAGLPLRFERRLLSESSGGSHEHHGPAHLHAERRQVEAEVIEPPRLSQE